MLALSTMLNIIVLSSILVTLAILGQTFRHPLNKYPGPLLAKWTILYRAYYDLVKNGGWVTHLEKLHQVYGPIVRVGPNELHFSDPRAYGEIYAPGSRFHKDSAMYKAFKNENASFFTFPDPLDAAVMKNILVTYLSPRSVAKRQAFIREKILELISRLKSYNVESGMAANLDDSFISMALDVLTGVILSQSFNTLSAPAFDHPFICRRKSTLMLNLWTMRYLPSPNTPVLGALTRFMLRMSPFADVIGQQAKILGKEIDSALNDYNIDDVRNHIANLNENVLAVPESDVPADIPLYPFLLQRIQEPTRKSATSRDIENRLQLLDLPQLIHEGINLRFAGTETTANACLVGVRYLFADKEMLGRLVAELDGAWPEDDGISYENLEKLPYLSAVIKESLRLSHGVVAPMGRVVGPGDAVIMGEVIPAGTTVATSAVFVHMNSELFPEPTTFSPERWLKPTLVDEKKETAAMEVNSDKYLVSFSKGPRSCPGIHLARCELYMIFAYLFRKLELIPTVKPDPNWSLHFEDSFTPIYPGDPLYVFAKERSKV